jgi:hypothetical protein
MEILWRVAMLGLTVWFVFSVASDTYQGRPVNGWMLAAVCTGAILDELTRLGRALRGRS